MQKLLLISLLFSQSVFAIETHQCPESISVSYDGFWRMNKWDIKRTAREMGYEKDMATIMEIVDQFRSMKRSSYQNLDFKLSSTRGNICRYFDPNAATSNHDHNSLGAQETRIYSVKGAHFIRVALQSNLDTFWVIHPLATLSRDKIEIKGTNAVVYGYENSKETLTVPMGNVSGTLISAN